MKVSIGYCRPCGYEKRAQDIAVSLQRQLGIVATLVPGKGGVFEVTVEGETVARRRKGHFPDAAEVVAAVAAALGTAGAR